VRRLPTFKTAKGVYKEGLEKKIETWEKNKRKLVNWIDTWGLEGD